MNALTPTPRHSHTLASDLPDDVVLSCRGVSKKFCRNLRRSMWYGMQDLAMNLLGIRPKQDLGLPSDLSASARRATAEALAKEGPETLDLGPETVEAMRTESNVQGPRSKGSPPEPDVASPADGLRKAEFWALRDVSFDLRKGEALGIIGDNGSGKTTLLRLITGIFPPDAGAIAVRGRVGALISLGAGFHPHLTGRENVYLNGAILAMTQAEIDAKFDDIAAFAEIGAFLDAPVTTYSSGMRVRLGFAIAIHTDPELLLVDEILAVGDASFQTKCMERMDEIRNSEKAVVLVTHSLYRIESLCDRALWLEHGRIRMAGEARQVVGEYLSLQQTKKMEDARERRAETVHDLESAREDWVSIEKVEILDRNGVARDEFPFGESLTVRATYCAKRPLRLPVFAMRIVCQGQGILEISMMVDGYGPDHIEGRGVVECALGEIPLIPKVYDLFFQCRNANAGVYVSPWRAVLTFRITDQDLDRVPLAGPMALSCMHIGHFYWPRTWRFFKDGQLVSTVESRMAAKTP